MKLSQLLQGYYNGKDIADIEITGVTSDSRLVEKGFAFVCIVGGNSDGHNYAKKAIEQGAAVIIAQRDVGVSNQIIVEDSRRIYGGLCGNFFGNPANDIKIVGITGTNGKTTCTYLIKDILESCGEKVGLMGTIHNLIGDMVLPARHTTPDPFYLHGMIRSMVDMGCSYLVMEISSHALEQHRLEGMEFQVGVFTNLTQDHLDYHITMDNYYNAKKKLFQISKVAVVNGDDSYGARLIKELPSCKSYGSGYGDYFRAVDINSSPVANNFTLMAEGREYSMRINMPGEFSVSNGLAAIGAVRELGFSYEDIGEGLSLSQGVKGRLQVIHSGEFVVIRDYAHSPDSLEKLLITTKSFAKGRVVLLFGCPGERDRSKRKYMGEIAAKYSDYIIVSEDNPRREPVIQIMEDIIEGLEKSKTPYDIIENRETAIKTALENMVKDDILLLAGKGHEDYQVLGDATHYFDEQVIVNGLIRGN